MKPKVFHIRIDSPPYYSSNPIAVALMENGFDCYGFGLYAKRMAHGGALMQKELLKEVSAYKPDLIFAHVQNSEHLDLSTWKELTAMAPTIHYTCDVRKPEESIWMYDIAAKTGTFTFFATTEDIAHCNRHAGLSLTNIFQSHSSCDMNMFKRQKENPSLFAFDVVFAGNKYVGTNLNFPLAEKRQEMVSVISSKYFGRSAVYGLGQSGGVIVPEAEARAYNYSKIAINQNNFNCVDYTSDRLWKIMATGTFCLSAYFPGIEKIFEKEKHLDWFYDFDEMQLLIDFYLKEDEERRAIADCGMKYVRENHTWTDRISYMVNKVNF